MSFEKWLPAHQAKKKEESVFINFGGCKQLYFSTGFCDVLREQGTFSFDIYVDKENRLIGLKFVEGGQYTIKRTPAQFGMSALYNEVKPAMGERLVVRFSEKQDMWVAHLDGEKLPDEL